MRSSPEFDLIGAIRERLAAGGARSAGRLELGIGDDAAVTVPGGATATSIDAIVDGVHFRRADSSPEAIGHKALTAALSDLAAMGADPGEAYVWLGRPDDLDQASTLRICDGLASAAAEAGVRVAGGDLTGSPMLALSVTVVGHAERAADFVPRGGASPGEAVCLTGEIGGAAAGLLLLERPQLAEAIGPRAAEPLLERQRRPSARIGPGRALAAAGATAMIDLSDGLGADAEQLAAASGVALELELERVPVAAGVEEVAAEAGCDRHRLALGGEDYELLCTLPRARLGRAAEAVAAVGPVLTVVGAVSAGSGVRLRLPDGRSLPAGGHDQVRR